MKDLLKLMKSLISKGFATKSEKEAVKLALKELGDDEKEALEDKAGEVDKLPEEKEDDTLNETKSLLKSLMADMKMETIEEVKSEFKAWMKSQADLMAKKVGIYSNDAKPERKALNNKFKDFCSSLYAGDDAKLKEMTTDKTGTPYAGYAVGDELSAEIRHLITEYGVARREMTALQLSKHRYLANNLATDVSVSWVDEGNAIGSKQVVLGQEALELKKLGAIITLTSELIADEEIDLFAFVGGRVAEKMAQAEDEAFFKGDGTATYGSFTGLLNSTTINEVVMSGATFASIDADDLIDMVDETPAGALTNAKYYMNRTIMSYVRKLKDNQNNYIYQPISVNGPATLWGYPIVLVEAMPTKTDTDADTSFVLFGDLKKACILGYKGAITAKRFDAGIVRNVANNADINLITTDREAIRWTERVGYIIILPTAITKLTTGSVSA